jgi:hypothetical protein
LQGRHSGMPEPEQARPLYFLPELNRNRFADGQNRNRFFW